MARRFRRDVLEEFLEEADFLYCLRRDLLYSTELGLERLGEFEARIDSHLNGLFLAGEQADTLLREALASGDVGRTFAAVAVALRRDEDGWDDEIAQIAAAAEGPLAEAIVDTFYFLEGKRTPQALLESWIDGEVPSLMAVGLLGASRTGLRKLNINAALANPEPMVRRAALRGVALMKDPIGFRHKDSMADPVPEVRSAALVACALTGVDGALPRLREICDGGGALEEEVSLLGEIGDAADVSRLAQLASRPEVAAAAVRSLGAIGTTETVDTLLSFMEGGTAVDEAAVAFTRVTGFQIPILPAEASDPSASRSEDSDEDAGRPDAGAARGFWDRSRGRFDLSQRWRGGYPLNSELWRNNTTMGDLRSRREEITRLRSQGVVDLFGIDFDAPARVQLARVREEQS
jgi:uncharacterized protein (TIGR02270 family)